MSGQGLEPQLEFSPTVLELGPLLPYSCGVEGTVLVRNPCEFPIEFYSLEFDEQYLVEEQVRGKVWSTHTCSHSFTVLQHSQDHLHLPSWDDGDNPRAKPGGKAWWCFRASQLCWKAVEGLEQSMLLGGRDEGEGGLAGESLHAMGIKKLILCVISLHYMHRSCGC